MNILVTGGAGYIGQHVVLALLERGDSVSVVDLQPQPELQKQAVEKFASAKLRYYQGDFADPDLFKKIFAENYTDNNIDGIIHLAAWIDVQESLENPEKYLENNFRKTVQLARQAAAQRVRSLVFASSAAVYGRQEAMPITETAALQPINPYGESKLLAEQALQSVVNQQSNETLNEDSNPHRLKVIALRFFNVCGSRANSGIYPVHSTALIAQLIKAAKQQTEFVVNGSDYPTKDGTCVRDLVHVQDIANACVVSLDHLNSANRRSAEPAETTELVENFKVYNVGTGSGFSIKEVVDSFQEILDQDVNVRYGPRKEGDIPVSVASSGKITAELGYNTQFSDLESIIKTSWH